MRKMIKYCTVVLWMGLISFLSFQNGDVSTVTSSGVSWMIYHFIKTLIPSISISVDDFVLQYMPFIRKMAHFGEFLILGVLIFLLIIEYKTKRPHILSIVICFVYAIFDEIHQYFVPNRYCSLKDIMIDTSGAIVGILLCYTIYKKWKK